MPRALISVRQNAAIASTRPGLRIPFNAPLPGRSSVIAAAFPSAPAITLDLPGNGALNGMRSPGRVDAMAAFCRTELSARGIAPPYRVVAMSLGAMVTTAWCGAHPDEIADAVLINTSLRPFSPMHQRLKPSGMLLRLVLSSHDPIAWERAVLALTSNGPHRQGDDDSDDALPRDRIV